MYEIDIFGQLVFKYCVVLISIKSDMVSVMINLSVIVIKRNIIYISY